MSEFVRADSRNLPNMDIITILEYYHASDKHKVACKDGGMLKYAEFGKSRLYFYKKPPKKAPTKGAKQILVENTATVNFYRNMALGAALVYSVLTGALYFEDLTGWFIFLNVFVFAIYIGCYRMMTYISQPTYGENGQLIDPGLDLNMEGGMGEHVKDIIILTSITHVLSIVSNYFWLLLLLLPLRAFWLLWTNILGPWFFQEAPQDTEQEEKKRKKIERKMKRFQQ